MCRPFGTQSMGVLARHYRAGLSHSVPSALPFVFPLRCLSLIECFLRVELQSRFSHQAFEFCLVCSLSMMLGLVFDVMFHCIPVGAANAECAISFLPCEIDSVFT